MDFDDLKERYQALPMWARLTMAAVLGLAPALYLYVEEGDALVEELAAAEGRADSAQAKFEAARRKKANLPNLEEQLAFTEEQLAKAREKLPDSYHVEDVLQKAATIAREVGVRLQLFDPGAEARGKGDYQYMEMPIKTEVVGRFAQVAGFLDRIVHLESSIFVRNVDLSTVMNRPASRREGDNDTRRASNDPVAIAREARQNLEVRAVFDLVVYRSMLEGEAAAAADAAPPAAGKDDKPAAKPTASMKRRTATESKRL